MKCNEKFKHSVLPTNHELLKLLKSLSRHFECVMVIVDGLDECSLPEERGNILHSLAILNVPEHGTIKTIYTSRDDVDIKRHFSGYNSLAIAARGSDLELYVAAQIELRVKNRSLRLKNPGLKEVIIDRIVSKAQGM